jgi:multidrug efflux pump subunit AcrA (membrane-fusion protein)
MNWKFIALPILAVVGIVASAYTVAKQNAAMPAPPPMVPPVASPYGDRVSGSGIVEPSSELIELGAPVSGLIEEVLVKEGQRVEKGQPLFIIDRRALTAQAAGAEARAFAAEARLAQSRSLPKPETLKQAQARADQTRAAVRDAQGRLDRLRAIGEAGAMSHNELPTREYEVANAESKAAEAEASLEFVRKGTYPEDLRVIEADVATAKAEVGMIHTELDRCIARAPIDAQILRIDARPGQYAAAGPGAKTQMTLGDLDPLYIRVDIDELDAWRFSDKGKAIASLRGGRQASFPVSFVRRVPLVLPKKTLSGENAERIDTRVLQVIYVFEDPKVPVAPGQLLDVFIESAGDAGAPDPVTAPVVVPVTAPVAAPAVPPTPSIPANAAATAPDDHGN